MQAPSRVQNNACEPGCLLYEPSSVKASRGAPGGGAAPGRSLADGPKIWVPRSPVPPAEDQSLRQDPEVTGTSALRSEIWRQSIDLSRLDVGVWRPEILDSPD